MNWKMAMVAFIFSVIAAPGMASGAAYYQNQNNASETSFDISFISPKLYNVTSIQIPRRANITSAQWSMIPAPPTVFRLFNSSIDTYGDDGHVLNAQNVVDLNWNTYAEDYGGDGFVYVNYSLEYFPGIYSINLTYKYAEAGGGQVNVECWSDVWGSWGSVGASPPSGIGNTSVYWTTSSPFASCFNYTDILMLRFYLFQVGDSQIFESTINVTHNLTSNISIDIGNNGIKDYTNMTVWNTTKTVNFNSTALTALNNYLLYACSSDYATGTCAVPFNITSATPGLLNVNAINLSGYYLDSIASCGKPGMNYSVNITFANEEGLAKMSQITTEYTLTSDIDGATVNFSALTSSNVYLCSGNGTTNVSLFLLYNKTGYGTRFYFLDSVPVNTTNILNITAYLLNDTAGEYIDIIATDSIGLPLRDAFISFRRYYVGENTYRTVAMAKTDSKGNSKAYLKTENLYYKFDVTRAGQRLIELGPSLITSSPLYISLIISQIVDYFVYRDSIATSCSFNAANNYLTCTALDPDNLASQMCLRVNSYNILNSTVFNLTCASGAVKTVIINVTGSNSYNGTVDYVFYTIPGSYILESGNVLKAGVPVYSLVGIVVAIMLLGIAAGIGIWNPAASVVMGVGAGIIGAFAMGMLTLSSVAIGSIIFVTIIVVWRLST